MNKILFAIICIIAILCVNNKTFAFEREILDYVGKNGYRCGCELDKCLSSSENLGKHYWFKMHWAKHMVTWSGTFCNVDFQKQLDDSIVVKNWCIRRPFESGDLESFINIYIYKDEHSPLLIPNDILVKPNPTEEEIEEQLHKEIEYWYRLINTNLIGASNERMD